MEIIIGILGFIAFALLLALFRAWKREEKLADICNNLARQIETANNTSRESQDSFFNLTKLNNEFFRHLYKDGGVWAQDAESVGLRYNCMLHGGDTPKLVIGRKEWGLQECYDKGVVLTTGYSKSKYLEVARTFSSELAFEAFKSWKRDMPGPEGPTSQAPE